MDTTTYNIVLVKSESTTSDFSLQAQIAESGLPNLSTYSSSSAETTRALLDLGGFDAAICQIAPGSRRDMETLKMIQDVAPEVAVIVVAASRDRSLAPWVIGSGAQDCLFEDEVTSIVLHRCVKYAVERKRSEATLQRLEQYDPVTGLLDERAFESLLNRWCFRASKSGRDAFALLVIEARELGEMFRSFSLPFGEDVLRRAARRVLRAARPGDSLAILDGGRRFALLLPSIVRLRPGHEAARRIAEDLRRPMTVQQQKIELTSRWSVIPFKMSFRDGAEMLAAASEALATDDGDSPSVADSLLAGQRMAC